MVFVPSEDVTQTLQAAETLGDLLEAETDLTIHVYVSGCQGSAIEAMAAQEADVGWLGAVPYAYANKLYGVEVELTTVRYGLSYYRSQFLVRSDSGINDLSDLAGKNFAFTDPQSTSGYFYPALHISKTQGTSVEDFFDQTFFAGGHSAVVRAVYDGVYDGNPIHGGATFEDARASVVSDIPDVYTETKVIAYTENIPNGTVSVRPGLDESVVQQVVDGLLDVASSQEGQDALSDLYGIDGLVPADDSDYDVVRDYVDLGADFETCSQSTPVTEDTGGLLTLTNDQGRDTTLQIPTGAVDLPTQVNIAQVPLPPNLGSEFNYTGDSFELTAIVSSTTPSGSSQSEVDILTTYTLTVEYDGSGLSDTQEANLKLYYWQDGMWVKEPSSAVNTSINSIMAMPDHFSIWAVLGKDSFPVYLPLILSVP
jgi:phosphonate transport system substrate-binding protein